MMDRVSRNPLKTIALLILIVFSLIILIACVTYIPINGMVKTQAEQELVEVTISDSIPSIIKQGRDLFIIFNYDFSLESIANMGLFKLEYLNNHPDNCTYNRDDIRDQLKREMKESFDIYQLSKGNDTITSEYIIKNKQIYCIFK